MGDNRPGFPFLYSLPIVARLKESWRRRCGVRRPCGIDIFNGSLIFQVAEAIKRLKDCLDRPCIDSLDRERFTNGQITLKNYLKFNLLISQNVDFKLLKNLMQFRNNAENK